MNRGPFVPEAAIELLLLVETGQLNFFPFDERCENHFDATARHEPDEGPFELSAVDCEPYSSVR